MTKPHAITWRARGLPQRRSNPNIEMPPEPDPQPVPPDQGPMPPIDEPPGDYNPNPPPIDDPDPKEPPRLLSMH